MVEGVGVEVLQDVLRRVRVINCLVVGELLQRIIMTDSWHEEMCTEGVYVSFQYSS